MRHADDPTGEQQIERIVRLVLQRLRAEKQSPLQPPASESVLVLHDRVVTLQTVQGRLEGVQCIQLMQRAAVTPSVRDELRRRKIELRMDNGSGRQPMGNRPTKNGLIVAEVSCPTSAAMAEQLAAAVPSSNLLKRDTHREQWIQIQQSVTAGSPCVVMTVRPAAICWLLNQRQPIRAAHVRSAACLQEAIDTMAVSVVILDPRSTSVEDARQITEKLFQTNIQAIPSIQQHRS